MLPVACPHLRLLFLLVPLAVNATAAAGEHATAEEIRETAMATVADRDAPGVSVEALVDPGLRLPACGEPLSAESGVSGTATVSCREQGWQVRVPLRVRRLQPVLLLARTVDAGQPVPADALRTEWRDTARLGQAGLADPGEAAGRVARRTLAAGSVLSARDLVRLPAIRRGDTVTLVSRHGDVVVRAAGRALGDAAPEDRLSAENVVSRKVVRGVLSDDGELRVP